VSTFTTPGGSLACAARAPQLPHARRARTEGWLPLARFLPPPLCLLPSLPIPARSTPFPACQEWLSFSPRARVITVFLLMLWGGKKGGEEKPDSARSPMGGLTSIGSCCIFPVAYSQEARIRSHVRCFPYFACAGCRLGAPPPCFCAPNGTCESLFAAVSLGGCLPIERSLAQALVQARSPLQRGRPDRAARRQDVLYPWFGCTVWHPSVRCRPGHASRHAVALSV